MKSKQLANVLIKILGLSLCAQSVVRIVMGILSILTIRSNMGGGPFLWDNFLAGSIMVAIGIFLIIKSRNIAEYLFKGEDE
jgi:hypothetical protein